MRVTPDGEAIAGQTLRYRQRRVPRKRRAQAVPNGRLSPTPTRSVSPGDGLAAFLFSWGRGSANGGSPRIRKRQDSGSPLDGFPVKKGETRQRTKQTEETQHTQTSGEDCWVACQLTQPTDPCRNPTF